MNVYFVHLFLVGVTAINKTQSSSPAIKSHLTNGVRKNSTLDSKCNVTYVKVGRYKEPSLGKPSFPGLLIKYVLPLLSSGAKWSLRGEGWDSFLTDLVCKCAQKTAKHNYNHFGVKSYDQCWSGEITTFYRHRSSRSCLQLGMQTCNKNSSYPCVGNGDSVFVYSL